MKYQLKTTPAFDRQFKKLDRYTQKMIRAWITKNLVSCEHPRNLGCPLLGAYQGQWRYRIGTYRLLCQIRDQDCVILALAIGHRRDIYETESKSNR